MFDLSKYEKGPSFEGDYDKELAALQERLSRLLVAHILHRKRSIIVFEGWDAAGKGGAIQRLTAEWDPRHAKVWSIGAPTETEKAHHFLWRFWNRLPALQEIAVFDRSWYGRVLVERVEGFATEAEWRRGYDEINEFEAQQCDDGTAIVKLFLHITQKEQDKRLKARLEHPWKRWKVNAEDFRNRARRKEYMVAIDDMLDHTHTRWAPWHVVDGNDKDSARIACLSIVANALEKRISLEPPPPPAELMDLARAAFGKN
jgi:polyphosphate kinase 2 (PPK2 family)